MLCGFLVRDPKFRRMTDVTQVADAGGTMNGVVHMPKIVNRVFLAQCQRARFADRINAKKNASSGYAWV